MELFANYILPNVALFGGIYIFSKILEKVTWQAIEFFSSGNTIEDILSWKG